jgi:hypothetical protein
LTTNHSRAIPIALTLSAIAFLFDGLVSGYMFASSILLLGGLLFLPVYLVLAIFQIGRNTAKGLMTLLVCSFGTATYCDWLDSVAMTRSEPIVEAINQYKKDVGNYPSSLQDLVPKYVTSFPVLKPTGKSPKLEFEIAQSGPMLSFKNGAIFSHKVYEFWNGRWVTYD